MIVVKWLIYFRQPCSVASALKKELVKPLVAYSSFTCNHMIITRSEMFSVMVHMS